MKSVEELEVFKEAHKLTIDIYKLTKKFPEEEKYGIISQMKRAAFSVAANLMEGSHRINKKEYKQFAGISKGSIGELKYYLLLTKDLKYISDDDYLTLKERAENISKMLSGLIRSLTDTDH